MASFSETLEVASPIDHVRDYLADGENLADWDHSIRRTEAVTDDGHARWTAWAGFYGKELELTYELAQSSDNCVEWAVSGKRVKGRNLFTIESIGEATKIDYLLELAMTGPAKLLDRGLGLALEGVGENAVQGLQRELK